MIYARFCFRCGCDIWLDSSKSWRRRASCFLFDTIRGRVALLFGQIRPQDGIVHGVQVDGHRMVSLVVETDM